MDGITQIQELIGRLLPILLLGPGILLVAAGLFMWLGGLRWLKAIAAFASAMAGLIGAAILTGGQVIPMVLAPVILAGVGIFLNRFVVVLLGAVIFAGVIMVAPSLGELSLENQTQNQRSSNVDQPLDLLGSIDEIEAQVKHLTEQVKEMIANIPAARKSTAMIAAIAFAGIGLFFWRFACALTCSTIGTAEIFMGMVALLLYKGTEALRQLTERGLLFTLTAAGMILLGTMLQMWLCPVKGKKTDMEKILKEEKQK